MKIKNAYGLSRNRDKFGNIVKRNLNPYVNCLHTMITSGFKNMEVLVVEIYEQEDNTAEC